MQITTILWAHNGSIDLYVHPSIILWYCAKMS